MSQIRIINLPPGDPLGRGRAYGEQARELIRKVRDTYEETFGLFTGQTWPDLRERSRPFFGPAEKFAPDLIREIEGIAQGAGLDFWDIFLLNARSEIMFSPEALERMAPGECTALLALAPATSGDRTYLAQNWDWLLGVRECQVLLKKPGEEGGATFASLTEAGQVAKLGLNSAGIGLVVNNLNTDRPRVGVPWILICRKILEAETLTRAMGTVLSTPRAHSINFLLARVAEQGAEGVSLETSPTEPHVLWPEQGFLAHTNHFLQPLQTARDLKAWNYPDPCTYLRHRRATQRLARLAGQIDVSGLKSILTDHFDKPHSVCMHQNKAQERARRTVTCFSVIFELEARAVNLCLGNPCRGDWERLDLSGFLSS